MYIVYDYDGDMIQDDIETEAEAKKLAEEGKAEVSKTPIFFQNGKKIVKKEEKTVENGEKPQKKAKKDKKVEVKDIEELAKEAEIVPLDDVSEEENGGF